MSGLLGGFALQGCPVLPCTTSRSLWEMCVAACKRKHGGHASSWLIPAYHAASGMCTCSGECLANALQHLADGAVSVPALYTQAICRADSLLILSYIY